MAQKIDFNQENNAQTTGSRSLYDAGYGEIFFKGLWAGIALGLGRSLATLLLFVVFALISFTFIQPWIESLLSRPAFALPGLFQMQRATPTPTPRGFRLPGEAESL